MATENKNLSQYDKSKLPDVKELSFGIVVSKWNTEVTENLKKGALETLLDCGVSRENIVIHSVPGSFELVNGAKQLLRLQDPAPTFHAIIVIGCIIQGETKHFDFVCQGVTQGIAQLNASHDTPVIFCVLTDNNLQQSLDRSGGKLGNKGIEAAITAIEMAAFKRDFDGLYKQRHTLINNALKLQEI